MIAKKNISVLALALLGCYGAQAQALPETLVKAARQAVLTNPEVQARWNGFKAAGQEQATARGGYFPQLDLRASVGTENRNTPSVNYGSYDINGAQLTLNQMLFDGLFTPSEVKRLGYAKLVRYYELAEISETTALEAVRAYLDVARFQEQVEAATQNYVEHKQSAQLVEERNKGGVGRGADVEQASGRLALAESSLLAELTNLHDASARYLRVIGEKPAGKLQSLPEPFILGTMPANTEALLQQGLSGSPTLNAALENTRAYKRAIATRQAAFMPRVDLRGYASQDKNLSGDLGTTEVKGVELVLNQNLYRGGSDIARKRQAEDQQAQARDLQEKACRDVRQTLTIAYSDVRNLSEQQRYLDQYRLATEKSREAYRQQFDIGQRTLLDVLDNQKEYYEASRSYINARHGEALAQARTLASMGQLVAALSVQRPDMPSAADAGQDRDSIDPEDLCPLETSVVDTVDAIKARFVTKGGPGSYVVLIPSPDGSIGRVTVQGKQGEAVLNKAGQAVSLEGSAPAPIEVSDEKVKADFGSAIAARPPVPEQFLFYFKLGSTQLTKESQALLPSVLAKVRARQNLDIWLIGHTDTTGDVKRNDALGLKRAQALAKNFEKLGIKDLTVTIESYGERNLLVATPDNTPEPRNRRGEVTLR
jgi:adhesin transport system outer membrane protein